LEAQHTDDVFVVDEGFADVRNLAGSPVVRHWHGVAHSQWARLASAREIHSAPHRACGYLWANRFERYLWP
jgi:hypothetical protein